MYVKVYTRLQQRPSVLMKFFFLVLLQVQATVWPEYEYLNNQRDGLVRERSFSRRLNLRRCGRVSKQRRVAHQWFVAGYTVTRFGQPNDKPVPADYDGKTDAV